MTSAWEWDTTRVLFAQGWLQVNYAVTVASEESHLYDVEEQREKPKEAETGEWVASLISRERTFMSNRWLFYLVCEYFRPAEQHQSSHLYLHWNHSVHNDARTVSNYKVGLWQLICVLHFKDVSFHLHLILNKQRDGSQQALCWQWKEVQWAHVPSVV